MAQPLTAKLGCLDEDGWPYVVPIIYHFADGGFYFGARGRSRWAHYLRRDPRCFLCLDERGTNRRVLVKGEAQGLIQEPVAGYGMPPAVSREVSRRYTGNPDHYATYPGAQEPGWGFFVRPLTITSWQGGWAKRYKSYEW